MESADATASQGADPLPPFYEALQQRHLASLTFQEVRRALQALSSLYVERRERLGAGAALDGAGKRAAFALYYGPLHFVLVREIVRALAPSLGDGFAAPRRILDLGCGTGTAGAAWALACSGAGRGGGSRPTTAIDGVDSSGWAVAETRWTLHELGLAGDAARGDAGSTPIASGRCGVIAAFTVNELPDAGRQRLLGRLLDAAAAGSPVLVVEPIARRTSPWWPEWARVFGDAGGRDDEWRFRPVLPPRLALLGKAAGLDPRELTGRSLALSAHRRGAPDG